MNRGANTYQISIAALKVNGQLLNMTLHIKENAGGGSDNWVGLENIAGSDTVQLIDSKNLKEYNTVTDSQGDSLSTDFGSLDMEPGQTTSLEAVFAVPPANVSTVNVQVGSLPPFNNVPIQR